MLEARRDCGGWSRVRTAENLPPEELHVWRVAVSQDSSRYREWSSFLSVDERARADRYRLEEDRHRAWVSRGALRELLARYLARDPAGLPLQTGPHGKPHLQFGSADSPVEFNVAHSGDWVLLALGQTYAVGVDIERWRDIDAGRIVRDCFSPAERQEWEAVPAPLQREAFFDGWTRKEAYVKALGAGLTKRFDSFQVRLAPGAAIELVRDDEEQEASAHWRIVRVPMEESYSAALACRRPIATIKYFELA